MVRQNIFELLEDLDLGKVCQDLDRYRAPASFHNGESNESNTLNLTPGILTIPQTSDTTGRQTKEISPVGLEEHLFVDAINKTYTNRLRLKQRIKRFYELKNSVINQMSTSVSYQGGGSNEGTIKDSSLGRLLKLEERIDIQLFRLN